MSLADDHVTVPAGGTASVDVILDPTIASPGAYSAIVTATPDNGGGTVRTGVSYQLESEAYDVKVTVKPRTGSQQCLARDQPEQLRRTVDLRAAPPRRVTRRAVGDLPAAARHVLHLPRSAGLAADGATEGVVSYQPSFTVSKTTEIVLDENETGPFGYDVERPVVTDAAVR